MIDKYYRYQLTYPIEGNKIYKSRSLKKVARKCYDEIKNLSDIKEKQIFCITNLDKKLEYKFTLAKVLKVSNDDQQDDKMQDIFDNIDIQYIQKMKNENKIRSDKWII